MSQKAKESGKKVEFGEKVVSEEAEESGEEVVSEGAEESGEEL